MESIAEIATRMLTREQLVQIPRTPEEIAQAKLRLHSGPTASPSTMCPICLDGGWVHPLIQGRPDYSRSVPCRCQKIKLESARQQRFLKLCDLPADADTRTLESFQTQGYTVLKEVKQAALDLLGGRITWLVLISEVDHGKTHIAIAVCQKWLALHKPAKYCFVPILLDELRAGFQNHDSENSYEAKFNFYKTVSLLVLDDLGTEVKTAWAVEKLETILDYRYINRLPTIITTNLRLDELTPRIRSRIERMAASRIIGVTSPEYLKIKARGTR